MAERPRPLSPFMNYRWMYTNTFSILHRITGVLLSVTCAVLAFFVVLRRMAFIGAGISHAALGGVALGVLTGLPPVLTAAAFSVGVAWLIGWISGKGTISEDTAIGVIFPTAMALGIALISLTPTYFQDLMGYLFGNIPVVREHLTEIVLVGISAAMVPLAIGGMVKFARRVLSR